MPYTTWVINEAVPWSGRKGIDYCLHPLGIHLYEYIDPSWVFARPCYEKAFYDWPMKLTAGKAIESWVIYNGRVYIKGTHKTICVSSKDWLTINIWIMDRDLKKEMKPCNLNFNHVRKVALFKKVSGRIFYNCPSSRFHHLYLKNEVPRINGN